MLGLNLTTSRLALTTGAAAPADPSWVAKLAGAIFVKTKEMSTVSKLAGAIFVKAQ